MEWLDSLIGALGGGLLTVVGSVVYFRPKLKEAKAAADKAQTEASVAEYAHLMERINTMEEMYKKQGEVIDELRAKLLKIGEEKFESDQKVIQYEQKVIQYEEKIDELTRRVDDLTRQVEAYKTITNK